MKCKNCSEILIGRSDKQFCDVYCKSAFQYKKSKNESNSFFQKVDKQLRTNRRILKKYNKAGKAYLRVNKMEEEGFNPKFFTHYWKNKKGDVYLFCFEFGYLKTDNNGVKKYLLIQWQDYMEK